MASYPDAHPLFHSDRGFQYTNAVFHEILTEHGMTQSMSRVGKCIDNKKAAKAQALGQTAPVANAQPAPVAQQAAPVKAPVAAQTVAPVQPQVAPKTQTLATALESLHKHQATQTQFKA